jgi:hypothetical protein
LELVLHVHNLELMHAQDTGSRAHLMHRQGYLQSTRNETVKRIKKQPFAMLQSKRLAQS